MWCLYLWSHTNLMMPGYDLGESNESIQIWLCDHNFKVTRGQMALTNRNHSCVDNTAQTFDPNLMRYYRTLCIGCLWWNDWKYPLKNVPSAIAGAQLSDYFINLCLVNICSKTCLKCPPSLLERSPCLERSFSNLGKFLSTIRLEGNWTCLERPPVWKRPLCLDIKGGHSRKVSLHQYICFISAW